MVVRSSARRSSHSRSEWLRGGGTSLPSVTGSRAEGGVPIGAVPWRPLALITLAVVVFGFALPNLGMVLALPLLVLMASLAGDEFGLKEVVINAIVLTLSSWLIFIKGLNLVIPLWPSFIAG
jgi:hypothetical protein